jgi:CRP-like cAMP-binding protein
VSEVEGLNQISRPADIQFEMISKVPLFASLGKKHVQAISGFGKRLSYDPGRKIVKEGEKGIGFYLILDGQVEVRSGDKVLAKLSKGNFFGEMALLDKEPRSADVVATAPTTCFGITGWSFEEILRKEPEIASGIIKELARRLREANAGLTE